MLACSAALAHGEAPARPSRAPSRGPAAAPLHLHPRSRQGTPAPPILHPHRPSPAPLHVVHRQPNQALAPPSLPSHPELERGFLSGEIKLRCRFPQIRRPSSNAESCRDEDHNGF
ncbi:hypothetical protein PVAP13_4KG218205 [Panicum virgatum]|uniref:Uncharacterized protein n=1 Tax=Panicum virgatum TaxID=38727 RepID=A0A8T0TPU8_PANVG|nr:hypothetical protein PVAP13_4KG218205 [Panicum virgatum]